MTLVHRQKMIIATVLATTFLCGGLLRYHATAVNTAPDAELQHEAAGNDIALRLQRMEKQLDTNAKPQDQ